MSKNRNQRGVALLFALGILSLLLVMGVAFVGNALISQKISANNQESASARLWARNAVDRAMAHLMMFHLVRSKKGHEDVFQTPDARSVYSLKDGSGDDLLRGEDSKLNVFKRFGKPWYKGSESKANWIYIHENGKESNGTKDNMETDRIIARYAYQVLPQTSDLRIPLFAVTSGSTKSTGRNIVADSTTQIREPNRFRWGVDIDEVSIPKDGETDDLFATCWGHAGAGYPPQFEFENFWGLLSGGGEATPLSASRNPRDVENLKRWMRDVFIEGRQRMAREAYTDNGSPRKWYPRFNLSFSTEFGDSGLTDKAWYSRFLKGDEVKGTWSGELTAAKFPNSETVLERLTQFPDEEYKDTYAKDSDADFLGGIPFLRRIGSDTEKGGFDTVANLRKQIAANLNDYCDEDSIPTSDVPAAGWGELVHTATPSTLPSFTGNEKTPYVNEIGFEFKLNGSTLDIDTGKYVFKPGLKGRLLAELIGIYRGLELHSAELYGKLNSLSVTLKVSIRGKVDLTYTKSGESTPTTVTADFSEGKEINASAEFSLTCGTDGKFTITDFTKNYSSNYWMGRGTDLTVDAAVSAVDFTDEIKSAAGLSGETVSFSNDNVTHVKVEVTDVKFNLGNLALKVKDNDSTPTVNGFVDFVRVDAGVWHHTGTCNLFNKDGDGGWIEKNKLAENTAETVPAKGFFYVGSMQAIDSRQNLFAKLDNVKESDWFCSFEPSFGDPEASHQLKWDALNKTGRVNVGSAPDSPSYANSDPIAVTARDAETTNDPAWQGDAANQHISTAVIRNAPMRSPWELGFIHRGIPFQTINLKKFSGIGGGVTAEKTHEAANFETWANIAGSSYSDGDAGILDQIKMTEYSRAYGKIDLKALKTAASGDGIGWIDGGTLTKERLYSNYFKSLFKNLKIQKSYEFVEESKQKKFGLVLKDATPSGTDFDGNNLESFMLTSLQGDKKLRSLALADLESLFGSGDETKNDAVREQLIGKIVNLIESDAFVEIPSIFKVVVVSQTILDVSGNVGKLDHEGKLLLCKDATGKEGKIGQFDAKIDAADPEKSIYFDEILSECRMLVTLERVTYFNAEDGAPRARLRVKQIEYLD